MARHLEAAAGKKIGPTCGGAVGGESNRGRRGGADERAPAPASVETDGDV